MKGDTRLVAVGVFLLFASSLIFLPTGVGSPVSAVLAATAVVGLLVAAFRDDGRRAA
ncbi:MAG: hypothetical protein ABEJ22_05420 [Haloferacaceae archaeon]